MFCLFIRKWSNQLWQSVCDSWSGVYQSTSQIFGTVNRNWAVHEVQEVIQCGTYCSVLHLYQQLYLQRFMKLNVCVCGVFFNTVWREKTFFFCLTLMPKSWCDWWMISHWTHIQGWAGVTHRIHMESCLLNVNARPSIWKPLLNLCNWHWTCHVINTPPQRWKKPSDGKCQQPAQSESSSYTPSVPSAPCISASHIMIQSGAARIGRLDWVCFLVLEQNPAEISSINHGQMTGYKQGD